jgi:hypothetical protein
MSGPQLMVQHERQEAQLEAEMMVKLNRLQAVEEKGIAVPGSGVEHIAPEDEPGFVSMGELAEAAPEVRAQRVHCT